MPDLIKIADGEVPAGATAGRPQIRLELGDRVVIWRKHPRPDLAGKKVHPVAVAVVSRVTKRAAFYARRTVDGQDHEFMVRRFRPPSTDQECEDAERYIAAYHLANVERWGENKVPLRRAVRRCLMATPREWSALSREQIESVAGWLDAATKADADDRKD